MQRSIALLTRSSSHRNDTSGASNSTKGAVAVITAGFIALVVYGGLYLPYYSDGADVGRERALAKGLREARLNPGPTPFSSSALEDKAPGSLWKNVAVHREQSNESNTNSGPPVALK
jgi:hypothetical protein